MDVRTGKIFTPEQVLAMARSEQRFMRPMQVPPTVKQRRIGKVGRNEPCPCGSGKKFKKCCRIGTP